MNESDHLREPYQEQGVCLEDPVSSEASVKLCVGAQPLTPATKSQN